MRTLVKSAGRAAHSLISRSRAASHLYLDCLGRVCRAMPDGPWKQFVSNSVQSVTWPDVNLRAVTVRFPASEIKGVVVPHLGEFDFQAHLRRQLEYEEEVFRWLNTRFYRTIIEIGANVGVFSLFLSKRFPQARVYSFEPSRMAFARLLTNVRLNACSNLVPFNCAICSESGFLEFHEPAGHLTNGSLKPSFAAMFANEVHVTPVPVLEGSQLARLVKREPVLIKIDVEGSEPQVLSALAGIVREHRPDLLLEVLPVTEEELNQIDFIADGSYQKLSLRSEGPESQALLVATRYRDYALVSAISHPAET